MASHRIPSTHRRPQVEVCRSVVDNPRRNHPNKNGFFQVSGKSVFVSEGFIVVRTLYNVQNRIRYPSRIRRPIRSTRLVGRQTIIVVRCVYIVVKSDNNIIFYIYIPCIWFQLLYVRVFFSRLGQIALVGWNDRILCLHDDDRSVFRENIRQSLCDNSHSVGHHNDVDIRPL